MALITVTRTGANTGEGPDAVSGLSRIAYLSSSLEIFWDRASSTDSFVTEYEISLNGSVAATLDALSFVDDSLNDDTEY